MDPQQNMHFISLIPGMAPRASQPPPLPPGIGNTLSPMMIPLATSDTVVMSSFSQPPPTISMIQSIAQAGPRSAQVMLPQGLAPPPDVIAVSAPAPVHPQVPPVSLYKCSTGGLTEVSHEVSERSKGKASLDQLQKAYTELNSRKIKDPLSSFLPDIPGEFDSAEPPGTMLLDLVENKPIGGKEFHNLSGQALLGFRLLPGPLPEQFRIDPPSMAAHTKSRKRKKHKHKSIDRSEDKSDPVYHTPPKPSKMPSDAYSFIKHESSHMTSFMVPGSETVLHSGGGGAGVVGGGGGGGMVGGGGGGLVGGGVSAGQILQQQPVYASQGGAHLGGGLQVLGDKKKKKKRDRDEKKKKKEKKKRKHHPPPDGTGHPSHPPISHPHVTPPPPSSTTTPHFPHPHS